MNVPINFCSDASETSFGDAEAALQDTANRSEKIEEEVVLESLWNDGSFAVMVAKAAAILSV